MTHIIAYIKEELQSLYSHREMQSLTLIICKHLLGLNEIDIYSRKDINLSDKQRHILKETVCRMKNHEPIQYILGRVDFYGLTFSVAHGVLIPRPETEELVDLVLKENAGGIRVLDVGTGSGCIAVTLAKHLPHSKVEGWDVSEQALAVAQGNAKDIGVDVHFSLVDVLSVAPSKERYDVIVSNPPYIIEYEKGAMDRNVLDWEPLLALFVPDDDPLRFYRHIAQLGREMLVQGGKLYFEINRAYGTETIELLRTLQYTNIRLITDLFGNNRIVTAVK